MSLMSSFYTGVSGLSVSQSALNTTAHNLANTETVGYTRQQVIQKDSAYFTWGTNHLTTLQSGLGVDVSLIKQFRDVFLDKAYRKEVGREGYYEVQSEAVDEVESMFGEMEGVTFQSELKDLWTSLQELSKNPNDTSRGSVIESAVNFINRAELISDQLNDYQVNLNTQISSKVNKINTLATSISNLNSKINKSESGGVEHANDLRDERNNLLDELGQIINITYKESTDGIVTVYGEGHSLVSESGVYKMGTEKVSDSTNMIKPVWLTDGTDVFNFDRVPSTDQDTDIGSLKGLLIARGTQTTNYTYNYQQSNYASDAAGQAQYQADANNYTNKIQPSVIMTVQAQFDLLIHGIVTSINNALCPTTDVNVTIAGVNKTLKVLSDSAPVGTDSETTAGEGLFTRKSTATFRAPTSAEITAAASLAPPVTLTSKSKIYIEEDPTNNYTLFTLGEIEVNPEILSTNSKLPICTKGSGGQYDINTINSIVTNWQAKFATVSPDTLSKYNVNDYYTTMIGELATRGKQYDEMSTNQDTLVGNINSQRQEATGVSSDEELTNLIKFQHAYNASSRYISVISDMLEHIISTLGS